MAVAAIIISRASPLAALVAATLTACGGGGGGGNNNGGSTQPPPPTVVLLPPPPMPAVNAPPFPALDLTAATAPDAFSTAQRVLEEGPPLATFAVFLTDLLMHTGPTSFGQCPTLPLVSTPAPTTVHFDLDADGTVSRGDILQGEMIPCTGDTATMVFRPTRIDTVAQRLEGRVEVTTRSASSNSLEGSFDLVSTFHSSTERFQTLSNLSFVLRTNGQAEYVTGARIEVGAAGPAFQGYSFSFEANVASERLGQSYRVATPVPLRGNRGKVPSEGEIVVESLPARAHHAGDGPRRP